MKIYVFLLIVLLMGNHGYSQGCKIQVFNENDRSVEINLSIDNKIILTNANELKTIKIDNISTYNGKLFKMTFSQRSSYLAYEAKLYITKDPRSASIDYRNVSLQGLCSNEENKYYVHIRERRLTPVDMQKTAPSQGKVN